MTSPSVPATNPPHLFTPLKLREVTFKNRIGLAPMCQYSAVDGKATDWHLVHMGARALGGAGMIMFEATAVVPAGRITTHDVGLWRDDQVGPLARVVDFIKENDAVAGVQLAHAGRKASLARPWEGGTPLGPEDGGWAPVRAASPIPFDEGWPTPLPLEVGELPGIVEAFAKGAQRALAAGFEFVEIHGAHGYLLHSFLSPLANQRTDDYGGSFENRTRLLREVLVAVREVWPKELPLLLRISCTDWLEGGWTPDESVELARLVMPLGVDLLDCSAGGGHPASLPPAGPGFQTPFAERVRRETGLPTGAVGLITDPVQADHIVRSGQADMVLLGRQLLREADWPNRAARELGQDVSRPKQYLRG